MPYLKRTITNRRIRVELHGHPGLDHLSVSCPVDQPGAMQRGASLASISPLAEGDVDRLWEMLSEVARGDAEQHRSLSAGHAPIVLDDVPV